MRHTSARRRQLQSSKPPLPTLNQNDLKAAQICPGSDTLPSVTTTAVTSPVETQTPPTPAHQFDPALYLRVLIFSVLLIFLQVLSVLLAPPS
ncbi:unnamed protein product [Hymenolepis diminuta]|nr:unnamed protein product [Hymenolepis diminuta]